MNMALGMQSVHRRGVSGNGILSAAELLREGCFLLVPTGLELNTFDH